MIVLTIPGKPIAKKRPKFSARGGIPRAINTQQTEEGRFLWEVKQQWQGKPMIDMPLTVYIEFYMPRPKGHYGTGRNAGVLKSSAPQHHTSYPDVDNLVKFAFDCLNGIAWKDDTQVVCLTAKKLYGEEPRTVIEIRD